MRRPWSPSSRATTPAAPARARARSATPAYAAWCYAQADPNPVAAGGAALLRAAGVDVERGPAWSTRPGPLNRVWTFAVEHGRPFVTWKFATTLDGRSAAADGTSRWVSGLRRPARTRTGSGRCAT